MEVLPAGEKKSDSQRHLSVGKKTPGKKGTSLVGEKSRTLLTMWCSSNLGKGSLGGIQEHTFLNQSEFRGVGGGLLGGGGKQQSSSEKSHSNSMGEECEKGGEK